MNILGKRKIWYTISLVILIIGLLFISFKGMNFGLDFRGGTLLEFKFDQEVSNEEVRTLLADTGLIEGAKVQQTAEEGINGVLIRTKELSPEQITEIQDILSQAYPSTEVLRTDMVGPLIGQELRVKALLALLFASIAIIIYISIRFEFRFAVVAILTLLHDVFITLGVFAVIGREINTAFVAALLTIIGYSINDTIVIFDRIRENMKYYQRKMSFVELANKAVIDTLPRSINTSITTLITILAVYFFGGASIKTFMLALFVGMFAGTYSSIFIASPLLVTWQDKISVK
ncbi:protein translocase subunit SecF [Iocasia frigidifontis]|uniref:Protein-export membrane protein SecF n=1 Tax=Iocasia fonsfrigidae TaxID=2682810 RepID=A0A8A7K957_9FIRM|nr:protein translocase subunit SecF [Iocasia fonsfrigidae]QTL98001.1 protein translocase subunit SecF [Iocasia fonsfrigidae]